jgi:predicted metalloprotease with PDZ domain
MTCRRALGTILLGLACLLWTCPRGAAAPIEYKISLAHPGRHAFHVEVTIPDPRPTETAAMPAWNALYQIRDFAYRVYEFEATATAPHSDPTVRMLDKQTWQINSAPAERFPSKPGPLKLRYSIEWNDPGPFGSQIDAHHAFLNLAEILTYLPGRRGQEAEVQFVDIPAGWRIAAELGAGPVPDSFVADGYDALVDAPVEIGTFDEFKFDEAGAHFRVVLDAKDVNKRVLEENLHRIVSYEIRLMGGAPFAEYTFIFHVDPGAAAGGGGMEHAGSTAIAANSQEGATAVAAHEFFHAWNVKRICSQALRPVDYSKEQYTRSLWFAEGVTNTYASFTLERTGIWSRDQFMTDLGVQISDLESRPARLWQSAEQSSLEAWLEKYLDYRQPSRSISYYNKGQILGDLLDIAIRDATDNRKSLDDVLRYLNETYAKQGKYYDDSNGIRGAVDAVAGTRFEKFFGEYVSGTSQIPYSDFLSLAGLELVIDRHTSADPGFWTGRGFADSKNGKKQWFVGGVEEGSAAEAAGLAAGDEVLGFNGGAFPGDFARWARVAAPGTEINLSVSRSGKMIEISFALDSKEEDRYFVREAAHPTEKQHRIRDGFFRGTTDCCSSPDPREPAPLSHP